MPEKDYFNGLHKRKNLLRILQVSTLDIAGGAERIAWNLFQAYQQAGFDSWLATGFKQSANPNVLLVQNDIYSNNWSRVWFVLGDLFIGLRGVPGAGQIRNLLYRAGRFNRWLNIQRGHDDFGFPGAWHLLDLPPERPYIIHCHNLHGGYFDLRALPWLSHQVPVFLTLHDAWLLSGHCAHSFSCERWKTGCGHCPDLTIPPAVQRDATAYNWKRKRGIYTKSKFHISTPSRWLMDKIQESMLMEGAIECRVIPNGVDISIFNPGDCVEARAQLGLPLEAKIVIFVANSIKENIWKDYTTIRKAIDQVAQRFESEKMIFIALGEDAPDEHIGSADIHFISYQDDVNDVALYYRAADVYVHAARADTFPNTVLESLACGTPVVATAVGGIPEQIEHSLTGFLVQPGDASEMANRIEQVLTDNILRNKMSAKAAKVASNRFSLDNQVKAYLGWYREILEKW